MELDELHVLEERSSLIRRRNPVASATVGIRRPSVYPARRARCDHDTLGRDLFEAATAPVESDDSLHAPITDHEIRQVPLLVEAKFGGFEMLPKRLQ